MSSQVSKGVRLPAALLKKSCIDVFTAVGAPAADANLPAYGISGTDTKKVSVTMDDIVCGLVKALVFGLLVTAVCCHQGYYTHMRRDSVGPEAVGNATTSGVVISCVLILASDYVLTSIFL